ncbi:hypothetical protein [Roseisolibacter agri]|uniref:Uncharacterized protein n=1 Tax=Roseisolibacter agri TaxID=2014610 RepID=A0AA37Q823_9BACT|nr:hypothetical protein [Roseisolibacter agri]GLC24721.1 hypothetical protein rosag_12340 [Roseisolibacter agri]
MRRPPLLALLPAVAALGCGNGRDLLAITDPCAVPPEVSAVPIAVGGDWWTEGAMPPTLHVEQDGSALRAELAFSGVIRQGGTGRVRGSCVELSFPGRAGTSEPAMPVHGQLQLTTGKLRIALPNGTAFTLVRRPAGQ